jgi:group I intron endonuclease
MTIGIYKLTAPSKKSYIGQSWDIESRFTCYMTLNSKTKKQPKLYRALKKYGPKNFSYEIIKICNTQGDLNFFEDCYITEYNSIENGYNIKFGGVNGKHHHDTKVKISETLLGKKLKRSEAHIEILRNTIKSKEWLYHQKLGKAMSPEVREKIRKAALKRYANGAPNLTDDHKKKVSIGLRKLHSDKFYEFISPTGQVYIVNNFRDFIEKNNLHLRSVRRVISNDRSHYKGWKIRKYTKLIPSLPQEKVN